MKKSFHQLGISQSLCDALEQQRITEPTPIQEQGIPAILSGLDVIAQAQTGTGKTLAFLLPIFDAHDLDSPFIEALVVTPTRELAIQIASEARKLAQHKPMRILEAYGGKDIAGQIKKLQGHIHLVIGTPGRILDHLRRGTIQLGHLKTLVLDEADQMLHIGFQQEIKAILKHAPEERQTLCFSATMPASVRGLAARSMKDPVTVTVESATVTLTSIHQKVVETTDREKQNALLHELDETNPFMAIIFCRTRRRVSVLNMAMHQKGYKCDELHGELTQNKREKVMKSFRNAEIQYLIATDVAARGLDIDGVTHVFNYDMAEDAESYIHRIGRTGRAGQEGHTVTFVAAKDQDLLKNIEREIGLSLPKTSYKSKSRSSEHGDDRPQHNRQRGHEAKKETRKNAEQVRGNKAWDHGKSSSKRGPAPRNASVGRSKKR